MFIYSFCSFVRNIAQQCRIMENARRYQHLIHMVNLCVLLIEYNYIQVNQKFCELNIGIVEKAQETRFGKSPKYNRYIGIAS